MTERNTYVVDPTWLLLADIGNRSLTRDDIIMTYAIVLEIGPVSEVDWPKVNHAIIDRWSPAALQYIKDKAWKIVEERP